jgi:A/G-specific adenine glycosylase
MYFQKIPLISFYLLPLALGARKVMKDFDGQLPETVAELKTIDGIGPYTAGAISSIAFNKVEPLVDGNVIRVLSRLYALKESIGAGSLT